MADPVILRTVKWGVAVSALALGACGGGTAPESAIAVSKSALGGDAFAMVAGLFEPAQPPRIRPSAAGESTPGQYWALDGVQVEELALGVYPNGDLSVDRGEIWFADTGLDAIFRLKDGQPELALKLAEDISTFKVENQRVWVSTYAPEGVSMLRSFELNGEQRETIALDSTGDSFLTVLDIAEAPDGAWLIAGADSSPDPDRLTILSAESGVDMVSAPGVMEDIAATAWWNGHDVIAVRRFETQGPVLAFSDGQPIAASVSLPAPGPHGEAGLAADSAGALYYVSPRSNMLYRLRETDQEAVPVAGGFHAPTDVVYDGENHRLIVACADRIVSVRLPSAAGM
ncbi:MAG: hypothetical protein GMKNLPBB_00737 [Myxococcota bacterium]|nr:hypothetical protein [Myxococcota bacterium]